MVEGPKEGLLDGSSVGECDREGRRDEEGGSVGSSEGIPVGTCDSDRDKEETGTCAEVRFGFGLWSGPSYMQ